MTREMNLGGSFTLAGNIEEPLTVLAELKQQGLIRHLALSNVTPEQFAEAQTITEIVPGTSSVKHFRENLSAATLDIPSEILADLDSMGGSASSQR